MSQIKKIHKTGHHLMLQLQDILSFCGAVVSASLSSAGNLSITEDIMW